MEVLDDKQPKPEQGRRRSDSNRAPDRTLDWSTQAGDVLLLPHSPLAISDVLTTPGASFDLIPTSNEPNGSNVTPINISNLPAAEKGNETAGKVDLNDGTSGTSSPETVPGPGARIPSTRQRVPRSRINLLSRHNSEELLQRCKRLLVESALIKHRDHRQLYLAAGFINYIDINDNDTPKRAPLLVYPMLLVRKANEQCYEVRIDAEYPEQNLKLGEYLDEQYNFTLPALQEQEKLDEYFAKVASSVSQVENLTLEFDISLGSAAPFNYYDGSETNLKLPDVPANFDAQLAMSITSNKSLSQLHAVLQLIPDYTASSSNNSVAVSADIPSTVTGLRKFAARLAAEGLEHIEFRVLPELPKNIGRWSTDIKEAMETRTVESVLKMPALTARQLIRLGSIIELIDKAPETIEQYAHGNLSFSTSSALLHRAHHQAKLIDSELSSLQEVFVLDRVPAKQQLLSLINELGGSVNEEPDIVDADYFNARRQFMEFSIEKPANLNTEHKRHLSQLAKVLRFRELFVNNTEYRAALGPGYKGLRTDWEALDTMCQYAQELSVVLESEQIAAIALGDWKNFREAYISDLEALQCGASSARRLLRVFGTELQSHTSPDLIKHAETTTAKLQTWHKEFGMTNDHDDKTAQTILSSFTGKTRDDVLVENQVSETQDGINRKLSEGTISREQITDTLAWLTAASEAATENALEIDAIVDHFQIA